MVPALYVPNQTSDFTVLMSHGNGEDLFQNIEAIHSLSRTLGVSVFMYEYNGYSIGEGAPSEEAIYDCVDAAHAHVTVTLRVPPQRIILHGRSLGSAPTVDLASRLPGCLAGLILVSPVASGSRILLGGAAFFGYVVDMFVNESKIHLVDCPTFIVHGKADDVVPCYHGELLHSYLQKPWPPLWLENAGHNDIEFYYGNEVMKHMKTFVAHLKENAIPIPKQTKEQSAESLSQVAEQIITLTTPPAAQSPKSGPGAVPPAWPAASRLC